LGLSCKVKDTAKVLTILIAKYNKDIEYYIQFNYTENYH